MVGSLCSVIISNRLSESKLELPLKVSILAALKITSAEFARTNRATAKQELPSGSNHPYYDFRNSDLRLIDVLELHQAYS